jgi:hypothetical protein
MNLTIDTLVNDTPNIPKFFFDTYKTTLKYSNGGWWVFCEHRWIHQNNDEHIKKIIKELELKLMSYNSSVDKNFEGQMMRIMRIIKNQCEIIQKCKMHFKKDDFYNDLDWDSYYVGFKNCVYDYSYKVNGPRDGRPEDGVSFQMGCSFNTYSFEDQQFKDLMIFLTSILPNYHERINLLRYLYSCLIRGGSSDYINFWIGDGQNGKSLLAHLIKRIMGDLVVWIPEKWLGDLHSIDFKMIHHRRLIMCEVDEMPKSIDYYWANKSLIIISNNEPPNCSMETKITRFTQKIKNKLSSDDIFEKYGEVMASTIVQFWKWDMFL